MAVFTRPPSLVLFLLAASAGSVSGSTSLTVTSTHTLTTGTYNFDSLTVGDGATLTIEGAVEIYVGTATIIGTIDGSARATANLDRASAGWPKNGPTSHFHRVAAGHGGQPGQWGLGTMYGSTFEPVTQGSSGNGAFSIGGAALKIEAQELVFDGVISMDGGHGLSVNNGNNGGGGSGGSVLIRAGVLKGSGTAVVTVRGGDGRGDGRWDGPCGGGGGRVALYCNSTEMEGSLRGLAGLPAIKTRGGLANGKHTGASGVAYLSCGDTTSTVYIDNENIGSSMETHLVDDGVTEYEFDRVMLYGSAVLAIEPSGIGDAVVTASVGQLVGDASGTLKVTNNRRVVGEAQPSGEAYQFDSNHQTSPVLSALGLTAGGIGYEVQWNRLYYLSDSQLLSGANVMVEAGGELVTPTRLTVTSVALTVHGTLSGVEQLAIGPGGAVSFESAGGTSDVAGTSKVSGVYEMRRLVVDGSSTLTVKDGVSAHADSLEVVDGSIKVHGAVALSASHMNMTADGEIDGSARATANLDRTSAG